MGAPRFVLDRFWPSNLFLGGIPGAWYDPTDLSTMFQDNTGTTPVTAVEQPVGLILDKSQGLALGSELVTNGDFSGGTTGWSVSAGGSIAVVGGKLQVTSAGGGVYYVTQSFATTVGKTYRMQGAIAKLAPVFTAIRKSDNATASVNVVNLIAALGSASGVFVATSATTFIVLQANGLGPGDSAEFDDISIRELAGNHASQSTAASRPTYRARYNLFTFSEQFQNAVWIQSRVTVTTDATTAPDGTTTADKIIPSAVAGTHRAFQQVTKSATAQTQTFSCYVKAAGYTFAMLRLANSTESAWASCAINLTTGQTLVGASGFTNPSATATDVGNGWWRVSITSTTDTDTVATGLIFAQTTLNAAGDSYTGNGTDGIFAWGAQLLTAADVTATGNAYQRIAAATVYDTAPIFRPYLAFDGMDDSLSTAAINFTSTDKMTTFVGTTVNSDAAPGMITELSADGGANAGAFNVYRPGTGAYQFFRNGGTSFAQTVTGSFAAPSTGVVTYGLNFGAATEVTAQRVNGAASGAVGSADTGSGNFGTYPLFIGRRNNASLPFNGRLYELIVRGAASSVTEIADTETWVNARTGGY